MTLGITGIGWVTAKSKGHGKDLNRFSIIDGPLPVLTAGDLHPASYQRFGRLDAFSKLGLVALSLALSDAGIDSFETNRKFGMIATTQYGCLDTDVAYYQSALSTEIPAGSPHLFVYTLPSAFLGDAAICFGLTGPCFTLNESRVAGLTGLVLAQDMLSFDRAEKMLVGACDLGSPSILKPQKDRRPYALFFLIERADEKKTSYGNLETIGSHTCQLNGQKVSDLFDLVRACHARSNADPLE
jgi:3-oxoacyl-[acyl-carrier-protein] synthase II